jgi:tetratricopeptide (TPR) repeat protein
MPPDPYPRPSPILGRVWSLLALVLAGFLHADPAADPFDQANLHYEQGHYAEAEAAYRTILETGGASAALHFNLGNTCFRLGQLGHAIAQFRLAQTLDPRDPDIAANLRFARQQVAGNSSVRPNLIERGLHWLRLDEWTLLASASLWTLFGLLALRQLRPALQPRLRPWTAAAALATASLILAAITAWHYVRTRAIAIVVQPEIEIRFGPVEASPVRFTALDGTELHAEDRTEDRVQVTDATSRTGWARRTDLFLIP